MDDLIRKRALLADINASVVFSGSPGWSAEIAGANKILDRIKAAPTVEQPTWIRVDEALPEKKAHVLLYFGKQGEYEDVAVGFWGTMGIANHVHWYTCSDDCYFTDCALTPTHWMPLPEAPKENPDD